VGIVAERAVAKADGTMDMYSFEGCLVMALETEPTQVIAICQDIIGSFQEFVGNLQEELGIAAVGFVA
jgi:hypothetical protein